MEYPDRMKKQFVNEIRAGQAVNDLFVLAEKILLQKKDGNNYLNVVLSDRSGRIKGVVWDNVEEIASLVKPGDVVQVKAAAAEYRGALQLVVKTMTAVTVESGDFSDFIPTTARDIDAMFERVVALSDSLSPDYFKALFQAFWKDDAFVDKFKAAPAAKKMHHAYLGGLLEHTLSMAVLADKIAGHYSGVDRDLLVAGALLHDIGKISEFRWDIHIDYSNEGRLLNHITIGVRMVEDKIRAIRDFPEDKALLLKHMVVSHHGSREFGSPEPPKTIEAVLLNYIDEIDSKVQGIREFMGRENPDEPWTSYHRLLERHFYRGTS
jgi:3'-5' exoribonuclease